MTRSFHTTIATVDTVYFDGMSISVTCPGSEGELTVLKDHEPFVAVLKAGIITVHCENKKTEIFEIESGILEVHRGGVVILL
ncbi:MAG TPA: F0F1 ATP synthase subunit epsilon [Candidatus Paceibacterota bacterium]